MRRTFLVKSPVQMVTAVTIIFMFFNAFLPLNFSFQAEATKYPFKLTITLERTTYRLGELVNVTWILTNIGEENVQLYNSLDMFGFLIRDENFIHVYSEGSRVLWMVWPFAPLAPGESWINREVWRQVYDDQSIKLGPLHYVAKKVPPGTYYVSGYSMFSTYQVELETPVIRITIIGG